MTFHRHTNVVLNPVWSVNSRQYVRPSGGCHGRFCDPNERLWVNPLVSQRVTDNKFFRSADELLGGALPEHADPMPSTPCSAHPAFPRQSRFPRRAQAPQNQAPRGISFIRRAVLLTTQLKTIPDSVITIDLETLIHAQALPPAWSMHSSRRSNSLKSCMVGAFRQHPSLFAQAGMRHARHHQRSVLNT